MIFLPNKFQRYTSALRGYIQHSVLINGIKDKHMKNLRIIYNAEALLHDEIPKPADLQNFLTPLLLAVYIIKKENQCDFEFKIRIRENCILDLKTFTALILNICRTARKIEVYKQSGKLIIKTKGDITKHSRSFIKKLSGCVYCERKSSINLIAIPFVSTEKNANKYNYKTTEEYITNPLSEVNIFI